MMARKPIPSKSSYRPVGQQHTLSTPEVQRNGFSSFSKYPQPLRRIPATSIWHDAHVPLVDRLTDLALADIDEEGNAVSWNPAKNMPLNAVQLFTDTADAIPPSERRILTTLLHFLVAQFGALNIETSPPTLLPTQRSVGKSKKPLANPDNSDKSSSRLHAANTFLSAFNYSVYLDSLVEEDAQFKIDRAREIRLLNLISLAALCRQLDAEKLRAFFKLSIGSSSNFEEMTLVVETIQECVLSLVDLMPRELHHVRPDSIMFQIAWRAHLAWQDILLAVNSAADLAGLNGLKMVEIFLKGMLKGLNRMSKRQSQSELQIQIVNPIIKAAVWNPNLHSFISKICSTLSAYIVESCQVLSSNGSGTARKGKKSVVWKEVSSTIVQKSTKSTEILHLHTATTPWLISEALASTAHVSGFLDIITQWLSANAQTVKYNEGNSTSQLEHKYAFDLIQWTLYTRVYSTRL
ncbi:hypothetical protein HK100_006632, partial [Physocladia obscura]